MNYSSLIFYSNFSLIVGGIIILAFALFVLIFRKKFTRVGVTFIYRTKLGKDIIEFFGKHERFFKIYGYLGIIFAFIFIAFGIYNIALYYANFYVFQQMHLSAVELALPIYIPGISIGVPIIYWLIAIIIAIVPHELSHGIVARANRIKIKNTGFGFAFGVIPIAFVELNEKKLFKSSLKSQLSVLAAGPFSNILIGIIALILYSIIVLLLIRGNVYFSPIYLNLTPVDNYSSMALGVPINHSIVIQEFDNKQIYYNTVFIPFLGQFPAIENNSKVYYNLLITTIAEKVQNNSIFLNQVISQLKAANSTVYLTSNNKTYALSPHYIVNNGVKTKKYGIIIRPFYEKVQPYALIPIVSYNAFPSNNLYSFVLFWLAGLMLWIFIFSFGVGIINILPVFLISDGTTFIFSILNKAMRNEKKARGIANAISLGFTFILLFSIIALL